MKVAVLIVGSLAMLGWSCSRAPKVCQVCQRAECHGLAFRITLENGRTVETCCPRCGLHYLEVNRARARHLAAQDYTSDRWIDATKAVYVSGSDIHHCAATESRRDAYGCCAFKAYDRCLPSVVAFQSREAAVAFQKQHGGNLIDFANLSGQG